MTSVSKEVSVGEAVDREEPRRETAEVERSSVVVQGDVHNAASQEEAIVYMEDRVHKVEASRGCDMVGEEIVVAGSNSRDRVACTHCTSAQREGTVDFGGSFSSVPYLAAYSAALPADDDCSSCRRGEMLPNRSRSASAWEQRVAVCGPKLQSGRVCGEYFLAGRLSAHRNKVVKSRTEYDRRFNVGCREIRSVA